MLSSWEPWFVDRLGTSEGEGGREGGGGSKEGRIDETGRAKREINGEMCTRRNQQNQQYVTLTREELQKDLYGFGE